MITLVTIIVVFLSPTKVRNSRGSVSFSIWPFSTPLPPSLPHFSSLPVALPLVAWPPPPRALPSALLPSLVPGVSTPLYHSSATSFSMSSPPLCPLSLHGSFLHLPLFPPICLSLFLPSVCPLSVLPSLLPLSYFLSPFLCFFFYPICLDPPSIPPPCFTLLALLCTFFWAPPCLFLTPLHPSNPLLLCWHLPLLSAYSLFLCLSLCLSIPPFHFDSLCPCVF